MQKSSILMQKNSINAGNSINAEKYHLNAEKFQKCSKIPLMQKNSKSVS
jgi:hypothetical protein